MILIDSEIVRALPGILPEFLVGFVQTLLQGFLLEGLYGISCSVPSGFSTRVCSVIFPGCPPQNAAVVSLEILPETFARFFQDDPKISDCDREFCCFS